MCAVLPQSCTVPSAFFTGSVRNASRLPYRLKSPSPSAPVRESKVTASDLFDNLRVKRFDLTGQVRPVLLGVRRVDHEDIRVLDKAIEVRVVNRAAVLAFGMMAYCA